jgi:LPS sulfotransferase NodH
MIRNFIIVGTQRTGSTAFFRTLNLHPEIACGREWTQEIAPHRKLSVARRGLNGDFSTLGERSRQLILAEYGSGTRWLGFKWLFRSSNKWLIHPRFAPALWVDRIDAARRWIASCPDISVIHISRENPLDWLKSKYLASETGLFARTPYPDGTKVHVPVRAAVKRIIAKRYVDRRLSELESTNPYLLIRYEDFARSNSESISRAVEFLGCDPDMIETLDKPRPRKQSKGSPSDYISNWDELVTELSNRGFYKEYSARQAQ